MPKKLHLQSIAFVHASIFYIPVACFDMLLNLLYGPVV